MSQKLAFHRIIENAWPDLAANYVLEIVEFYGPTRFALPAGYPSNDHRILSGGDGDHRPGPTGRLPEPYRQVDRFVEELLKTTGCRELKT